MRLKTKFILRAMVTLAFGTIIQILINERTFLTEGPLGIKLAMLILGLVVVHRILRSHQARASEALRANPVASDCLGSRKTRRGAGGGRLRMCAGKRPTSAAGIEQRRGSGARAALTSGPTARCPPAAR